MNQWIDVRPSLRPALAFLCAIGILGMIWVWAPAFGRIGLGLIAMGAAMIAWVVAWPAWVWICLCILSAANRIVSAIDRTKEKSE